MVTIRLPDEMEAQLEVLTNLDNTTKTEVIRTALSEYIEKHLLEKSSYELGKDLFGKYSSDESDRSVSYKERIRKIIHEKYSH